MSIDASELVRQLQEQLRKQREAIMQQEQTVANLEAVVAVNQRRLEEARLRLAEMRGVEQTLVRLVDETSGDVTSGAGGASRS